MQRNQVRLYVLDRSGEEVSFEEAGPGHVLVAEVSPGPMAGVVRQLQLRRRAMPWASLILVSTETGADHLVGMGVLAAEVAAQVVVTAIDDWPAVLDRLCDCSRLADHCTRWLALQRPKLPRLRLSRIRSLIDAGVSGRRVDDVAHEFAVTVRVLDANFHRAGLPAPGKFLQFGRLMPGLAILARTPETRLIDAAHLAGYATTSAFIRALRNALEMRAQDAKVRLGFEWAAHSMLLHQSNEKRRDPI